MAVRSENFEYRFEPAVLVRVRESLGIAQSEFASQLGVPVNTVSRWERGFSTPDGHSLAAIYSIAARSGNHPRFFVQAKSESAAREDRRRLVFIWDLISSPLDPRQLKSEWDSMAVYLRMIQPQTQSDWSLIAFAKPDELPNVQTLASSGFEIRESRYGHAAEWIDEARHAANIDPRGTVLVLATGSQEAGSLLRELRRDGVAVYLWDLGMAMAPTRTAVGQDNLINRNAPFVLVEGRNLVSELDGSPVSRDEFNQRLRDRLMPANIFPSDAGFSEKNPYGNVIDWLERKGVIEVSTSDQTGEQISLSLTDAGAEQEVPVTV